MAYVTVPKDLTKIKSKMLFGLTKRQLVCFGSAALIGVPLFFLSKGSMGTTPAALCMILVMLPFFLFALYEKNGQTPEALLGHLIQCKFTRPKKRVYQTNNAYSALEKQAELDARTYEVQAGGGAVTVTINGKKEVLSIDIKPEIVDPEDIETLSDILVAGINEAIKRVEDANTAEMEKITGDLAMPGLF